MRYLHFAIFIATTFFVKSAFASDLSQAALNTIATNYKACIKEELIASTNEDGSLDEVFFLEGKEHCDNIKGLEIRKASSEARISQLTDNLINEAKQELGIK